MSFSKRNFNWVLRLPDYPDLNDEEVKIMKQFTSFIAEFAKKGNPVPANNDLVWPAFKPGKGASMLIESPMKLSRKLPFESQNRPGRMQFWMDLLNRTESLQLDYLNHDEL